jgi:pilus assembly protein CpaB
MNLKTWLPLCLALVLGLGAAMFARNMIAKNKGEGAAQGNLTQVVVAKQAIGAGEALTPDNCLMGSVGLDSIPDGSFRSMNELKDRVAQVQMGRGQAITENLLAATGTGTGLQVHVKPGMRAITIEVNEFSGVGGMLLPGCHVDLLATVQGEQGGEMVARTIVQNVEILAVGQRMVQQPDKKGDEPQVFRSVTMLATPTEAEAIELAANSGRPRLVLRSGIDKELAVTPGVTSSNLRGNSVRKTEPAYSSVKVIRGTVVSEVRFDGSLVGATANSDANAGSHSTNKDKSVTGAETGPVSNSRD